MSSSGDLNASRPILAMLAFSALARVVPSASMAALTARMRRAGYACGAGACGSGTGSVSRR